MIKILKAALRARFNNNIGVVTWDWNITSYLDIGVQYKHDKHRLRINVAPKLQKIFDEHPLLNELTSTDDAIYPTGNVAEVSAEYLKCNPLLLFRRSTESSWASMISWCSRAC